MTMTYVSMTHEAHTPFRFAYTSSRWLTTDDRSVQITLPTMEHAFASCAAGARDYVMRLNVINRNPLRGGWRTRFALVGIDAEPYVRPSKPLKRWQVKSGRLTRLPIWHPCREPTATYRNN